MIETLVIWDAIALIWRHSNAEALSIPKSMMYSYAAFSPEAAISGTAK